MKIERLDLIAFGRFTDTSIDLATGNCQFHLIYGPNESGKSTSLRAITSLLYGMPQRAEDHFLHPTTKMRIGARLSGDDGGVLECIRRRGRKSTLRDDKDDQPIDDAVLAKMLGGIDREAFEHRFGLSHDELVKGGEAILAGQGDLGEILFAAGAGVSQLRAVGEQLNTLATARFVAGGKNGTINQLIRELAEKKKELEQVKIPPSEFNELREQLDEACDRAEKLQASAKQQAIRLAKMRAIQKALPLVPQWHSTRESLHDLADAPHLDDAFVDRRRSFETKREVSVEQVTSLNMRFKELKEQLQSLGEDQAILLHEAEIESLFERLGARDEARKHRVDLERKRLNMDRRMVEALEELSIVIDTTNKDEVTGQIDKSLAHLRIVDSVRTKLNALAQKYAMIVRQRDDADEQSRSAIKKLAEFEPFLDQHATPPDPNAISQVLESVGSPDAVLSDISQQRAAVKKIQKRCEQLCRKLEGFEGTYAMATSLRLPNEAAIDSAASQLKQREQSLARMTEQWNQLSAQQEQAEERLQSVQSLVALPTPEQLTDARGRRDQALVQAIADQQTGQLDAQLLFTLQQETRKADELVDAMRVHHEQLHQQASIQAELRRIERQRKICQASRESAKTALDEAQNAWQTLWQACGIAAADPDRMVRWIATHTQLVEAVLTLHDESEQQHQLEERLGVSTKRLKAAITAAADDAEKPCDGSLSENVSSPEDFASLYDQAAALRSRLQDTKKRHDDWNRQRDMIRSELPTLQTRLESRQKELDQWHADWSDATSALSQEVDRTPAVVIEKIAQIDAISAQQRERDILSVRIRSIREDNETYRGDVQRLVDQLEIRLPHGSGDVSDVFPVVKELFQRMQTQRSAAQQKSTLQKQLDSVSKQLQDATQQASETAVALQKLCEEARCDAPEKLVEVERRSKQRQQLEASRKSLEEQLRILANHASIDKFVSDVQSEQPELVEFELESLDAKLQATRDQLTQTQQEVGVLRHRLQQIDGSARASELSQSIQLLAGQMEHEVEEYARVKIAAMMLQQSIEHYRQENQGPVLGRAAKIFRRLTLDEYQGLKVDTDPRGNPILCGTRPNKDQVEVPANAMSTGTADALYLSLRLASIDHQLSRGQALPLIIDDCLVQLDDDRSKAALETFAELSNRTQVILFTHHEHVVELAKASLAPSVFEVHRL
ncbi:YhaN family protein [Novipirellula artificiosorum]|uniref:Chromosome segregation protein n=1 Tax=Novipirellula artificiosorum TaxID=2528016 RepID=A0A5C6E326_9BACT|nr:YhaN family protein [Novipirellula artificiosorum]TWU42021.1 chromosome segregation protein [Novipirellula artificiosorum]